MTIIACVLALLVGLGFAIGRALLVDEAKGQLWKALDRDLESTIERLPPSLRDEWEDEWRAEFEATRDRPLSAIRFVRGLRRSVPLLVADANVEEPSHEPARSGRRALSVRRRVSRRWRRVLDYRAARIERSRSRAHAALHELAHPGQAGAAGRFGLRVRAFIRFAQADIPYVTRSLGHHVLTAARSLPSDMSSGGRGLIEGGRDMTLALIDLGKAYPRLGVDLALGARQIASETVKTIGTMSSVARQVVAEAGRLEGTAWLRLAVVAVAILLGLILPL